MTASRGEVAVEPDRHSISRTEIPARELRNDVSSVLRRVEGGEHLTVTVSGRPVAVMAPLGRRPRAMPWQELFRPPDAWCGDAGAASDPVELSPEDTDDIPIR